MEGLSTTQLQCTVNGKVETTSTLRQCKGRAPPTVTGSRDTVMWQCYAGLDPPPLLGWADPPLARGPQRRRCRRDSIRPSRLRRARPKKETEPRFLLQQTKILLVYPATSPVIHKTNLKSNNWNVKAILSIRLLVKSFLFNPLICVTFRIMDPTDLHVIFVIFFCRSDQDSVPVVVIWEDSSTNLTFLDQIFWHFVRIPCWSRIVLSGENNIKTLQENLLLWKHWSTQQREPKVAELLFVFPFEWQSSHGNVNGSGITHSSKSMHSSIASLWLGPFSWTQRRPGLVISLTNTSVHLSDTVSSARRDVNPAPGPTASSGDSYS